MIKLLSAFSLLIFSTSLTAAGFDCKKARNFTEHTICNDKSLSDLDSQLTTSFRNAIRPENKNRILLEQRKWLKTKRNLCQDSTCLINVYNARINELKKTQIQQSTGDQVIQSHKQASPRPKQIPNKSTPDRVPELLFPSTKSARTSDKYGTNAQKDTAVKNIENWETDVLRRIDHLLQQK